MQQQFFGAVNGGGQWANPFPMQLQAGMHYQILVEPMQNIMTDLDLFIHNPVDGALLAIDNRFNPEGIIFFVAPYSGLYYLTVASKNAPTSFRLTITI